MPTLIDSSVWIDFFRTRSPPALKRFIAPFLRDPEAHLAGPVIFEILRNATAAEVRQTTQQLQAYPLLGTPLDLWTQAAHLGQVCRQKSFSASSLDLLIAAIALHHGAEIITFDDDFQRIARVSNLRVKVLTPHPNLPKGP
jgi:predicted nucleic acid-binding protein